MNPTEPGQTLFAFYGRVSTEDNQDAASSRAWQLTRSKALIEPRGGVIVAEFFDVDKSRSIPWQRRPQASRLLADLRDPGRGFEAVVIGEPHRAFYGNQYGLTFPVFQHYGGAAVGARGRWPDRPVQRSPRLGNECIRRDEQGRAAAGEDPGARCHGRASPGRGPVSWRAASLWLPYSGRRAPSQSR